MKKVFIGLALATIIATGACAQDQSTGLNDRPYKGRHHRPDMAQQLNLTETQKAEMKTINDDFKQQMDELKKSEDKITVTEWKSKMTTLRKDRHEKVSKLLTAEQKESLKNSKHDRKGRFGKHGRGLEHMKKELNLTDEQVASLKKSHEAAAQQFKAIKADKSLTDEQKKAEMKAFKQQQHDNLKSILTPEQLQKLEQNRKEHKSHRQSKPVQS